MESIYSSGNEIVDAVTEISLTGNVIPQAWYQTIRKDTGKPYLTAIIILADIVYWYRATQIRDESTGQVIGTRKKFKSDLLQRSYSQIAEQFGISKRDATSAIVHLEKMGVISRIFRTICVNGQQIPNILFLKINVNILVEITHPHGAKVESERGVTQNCDTPPSNKGEVSRKNERGAVRKSDTSDGNVIDLPQKCERGLTWNRGTNTENTTENTTKSINHPILSYQQRLEDFKDQIGYDAIRHDLPHNTEVLDSLVGIAVDVLVSENATIRVNQENKPVEVVKSIYSKLNIMHIKFVLNSFEECGSRFRDFRAVVVTALYNAYHTMSLAYANLYNYHQNNQ